MNINFLVIALCLLFAFFVGDFFGGWRENRRVLGILESMAEKQKLFRSFDNDDASDNKKDNTPVMFKINDRIIKKGDPHFDTLMGMMGNLSAVDADNNTENDKTDT